MSRPATSPSGPPEPRWRRPDRARRDRPHRGRHDHTRPDLSRDGMPPAGRLGIHGCPAFDVQAVCTGFIYALGVADKFVKSGSHVRRWWSARTHTRACWTGATGAPVCLFGDGAGAVVIGAATSRASSPHTCTRTGASSGCCMSTGACPGATGRCAKATRTPRCGRRGVQDGGAHLEPDRRRDAASEQHGEERRRTGWCRTRPIIRIIEATARKLKLSPEQVVVTIGEHGNTSAGSVPLALDVAVRDGRIKRGDTLLLEAFGGGFTWGSALIRY